MGLSTSYI